MQNGEIGKWIYFLSMALLAGCSAASVRVESQPSGAAILLNDKNIGVTPLDISESTYREEFSHGFLDLKISQPGYQPSSIIVATSGVQSIKINLALYSEDYFAGKLLTDFQWQGNQMVREILQIQGFLVAKDTTQASGKLDEFLKKYPNIAAAYVLKANLEMSRNQPEIARRNLERALSLDPKDPVIVRMMANFKAEGRL